jgi:hypothetical protein
MFGQLLAQAWSNGAHEEEVHGGANASQYANKKELKQS